jgi:hypothetical protein
MKWCTGNVLIPSPVLQKRRVVSNYAMALTNLVVAENNFLVDAVVATPGHLAPCTVYTFAIKATVMK